MGVHAGPLRQLSATVLRPLKRPALEGGDPGHSSRATRGRTSQRRPSAPKTSLTGGHRERMRASQPRGHSSPACATRTSTSRISFAWVHGQRSGPLSKGRAAPRSGLEGSDRVAAIPRPRLACGNWARAPRPCCQLYPRCQCLLVRGAESISPPLERSAYQGPIGPSASSKARATSADASMMSRRLRIEHLLSQVEVESQRNPGRTAPACQEATFPFDAGASHGHDRPRESE